MNKFMEKMIKTALTFVVAFATFANVFSLNDNDKVSAETDHSSQVTITDWNIIDKSGEALSETNAANPGGYYQLQVSWSLALSGELLHEGDVLTFGVPKNTVSGGWSTIESGWEDFVDDAGVNAGKWRIIGNKFEVVLGQDVEGSHTLNATFLTGDKALYNNTSYKGVQNVNLGGVIKPIAFNRMQLGPLNPNIMKYSAMTSNTAIRWFLLPNQIGNVELAAEERGQNFTVQKNTFLEDKLEGEISVDTVSFVVYLYFPVTLEEGRPAMNGARSYDIADYFTLVSQNSGETYAQFKSRLKPFEWGIYKDTKGINTLAFNLGDMGDNGLKYSDLESDFAVKAANDAIRMGYYDEVDRSGLEEYFTTTYGDNNVIGGNIASMAIAFNEEYDKVVVDTEKINTVNISKNNVTSDITAKGVLQGNMGLSQLLSSEAGVFLYDQDTNELLEGGTFKLQMLNNGQWEDYAAQPLMTTDADGFAKTGNLPLATYRFVEVSPSSDEYDLTSSEGYDETLGTVISSEFTIKNTDTEGYKIPVSNLKYRYDVTYAPGTNGLFTADEHKSIIVNSDTPEFAGDVDGNGNPLGEEGYEFIGWDVEISPTVTKTVVYTAMWRNILTDPDVTPDPDPDVTPDPEPEPEVTPDPEEIVDPEVTPEEPTEALPATGFNQLSAIMSALMLVLFAGIKIKK